jgi:hypothetical protein
MPTGGHAAWKRNPWTASRYHFTQNETVKNGKFFQVLPVPGPDPNSGQRANKREAEMISNILGYFVQ